MKDIPVIRGRRRYIEQLLAEGEHEHQDFKYTISDARKIARSISAFANNDGGRLLIGVKDNGTVAGVRNEEDIYVVEQAAEMYCQPPQHLDFTAFSVGDGLVVIRAAIAAATNRPIAVREADGRLRSYFRVADENIVAHPLMEQMWRRRQSDDTMVVTFTRAERALLEILSSRGRTSVEQYMTSAHISRRLAEETVVKLTAMGIVKFVYDGGHFCLEIESDLDEKLV